MGLLNMMRMVLWSFFGVRRGAAHEADLATVKLPLLPVMAVVLALCFGGLLFAFARIAVTIALCAQVACAINPPSTCTARSISAFHGCPKFSRTQFRKLRDAEKIGPGATLTPCSIACLCSVNASTCSGNSSHTK
jgi:Protein of unknown function (DUF2970)